MNSLYPLFSLMMPFLLWPVEFLFPYPHIIEEIAKGIIVALIKPWNKKSTLFAPLIIGVAFALSETMLYAFDLIVIGSLELVIKRLVSTSILHSTTTILIFALARQNKKLLPLGILLSALLHYFYNQIIVM